jgi:hypothetical protein
MEDNFFVFFKNYLKNKEVPEIEKLINKEEYFDSNYNKCRNDIINKKNLLHKIKADTLQKM